MSEQTQPTEGDVPQPATGTSTQKSLEKSLTGSSYSVVNTMQTSEQNPEDFVTSDDD